MDLCSSNPSQQPTLEAQKEAIERQPWTIVHGFYATMGGLATRIPENFPEAKRFLPPQARKIWFLTQPGLRLLLKRQSERDDFPDLSTDEIEAKSKASGLAKSLVCIQALWFLAQCLTRRK